MKATERMNALNNNGIDTSKFFTLNLPDGLGKNSSITVMINEQGKPEIVERDEIEEQIIEDGYVRNTMLHRRFVMAQMFHMMSWKSRDGRYAGYTDCLNRRFDYKYQFTMMRDEVKVLAELEVRDVDAFNERVHFFNKGAVASVLCDYVRDLRAYVSTLKVKHCKGIPYVTISGRDIFIVDLEDKVFKPLEKDILHVHFVNNYRALEWYLNKFCRYMIRLPYDTKKSKAWVDAYKGAGAYYTLKNLIMYHNCKVYMFGRPMTTSESMNHIKRKLEEYRGEGWRMFGLMKQVIADNRFSFRDRMGQIYR